MYEARHQRPLGRAAFVPLAATVAAVLLVWSWTARGADNPGQDVSITLQSDGKHCVVGKAKIICADVIAHLREVLKLPPGTRVRLRAGRAASHQSVKKVMDMLDKSEYPLPVAYLTEPKTSR